MLHASRASFLLLLLILVLLFSTGVPGMKLKLGLTPFFFGGGGGVGVYLVWNTPLPSSAYYRVTGFTDSGPWKIIAEASQKSFVWEPLRPFCGSSGWFTQVHPTQVNQSIVEGT